MCLHIPLSLPWPTKTSFHTVLQKYDEPEEVMDIGQIYIVIEGFSLTANAAWWYV